MVIVLALLAAVLSAVSAAGEQHAAFRLAGRVRGDGDGTGGSRRRKALLGSRGRRIGFGAAFLVALLASPLWLSSWALDAASFFTQATALHLGSISAVQPLMVTTLLFALPLAALGSGRSPGRGGWIGAGLICAGLALVLSTRSMPATATTRHVPLLAAMGAVVVLAAGIVAAAVLLTTRRSSHPALRAALLSVAAGGLFAVGAAITKLTAATFLGAGLIGILTSWPGYALAGVSLASFSLQQFAYASGPLAPAITAVVITDPLVAYVLGIAGFGELAPRTAGSVAAAATGGLVLAAGIALIARSPLLATRTPAPVPDGSAPSTAARDGANRTLSSVEVTNSPLTHRQRSRSR